MAKDLQYNKTVEKGVLSDSFELFWQEDEMRAPREPVPSIAGGGGGKHDVRCSECGRKLMTLKDHIQKEDSFVCASCYHNMVYGHHTVGIEVFE
jgi:hypothetical protein